jgi:hypothetical protein
MSARTSELTPRSESAWFAACAAALPASALQILREAHAAGGHQVDAADAFIALVEQKTEAQARSKARREEVKGWGSGAREGEDEAGQIDQIDPITPQPGLGAWAFLQDPAAAREALEIRAALEACDPIAALESAGLSSLASSLAQDPAAVNRLRAEMQSWAALADLDEANARDIALRDRVTRRMAQHALRARREALEAGQGVLL